MIKRISNLFAKTTFVILFLSVTANAYEDEPDVFLSNILTPELVNSLKHNVDSVRIQGGFYFFNVSSDYGDYEIASFEMLRERVREIYILGNAINQFTKREDSGPEQNRGQLVIRSDRALDIVTRPVSSASNLAGQIVDNLGETLDGPSPDVKKEFIYKGGESSDPVASLHKRNVASQWNLDPYSTNHKVQDFLNAVAHARSAGQISAGTAALNRHPVSGLKVDDELLEMEISRLIRRNNVQDLNNINKKTLEEINIKQELQQRFLQHPAFSPAHRTVICRYLGGLKDTANLDAFFETAVSQANMEFQALNFVNLAKTLVYYHTNEDRIKELLPGTGGIKALSGDASFLYFTMQDIVYWNENTETLYENMLNEINRLGSKQWYVISFGSFTQEAGTELQERHFFIQEKYIY